MWRTARLPEAERRAARAARAVSIAATLLFVLLLTRWQPWELFARAGYTSDFYDEQARALWHGRLSVDPDVAGIEGFLIDGKTYLYYGPLLALARLPTSLVGHALDGRLVRLSMTIGFLVWCTGLHHLVGVVRQWWSVPASAWRSATLVAAGACSPMLALAGWVSVYHETELWAATFAVWAMVGALRLARQPDRRAALLAGGATAAALLTRASVGIGIAAGVGAVALVTVLRRRCSPAQAAVVIGGCAAGLLGHMAVNAAKFGSLLGLPADRQVLTLQDPERAAWFVANGGSFFNLQFLPSTVIHYLRPDTVRFERLLPFVRFGPPATDRSSLGFETITPAASLTASATLLVVAAVVGLVVLVRARAGMWLLLVGGAALATVPTLAIGFIGNRYLVDLLPLVVLPAAVGIVRARGPQRAGLRRAARIAVVAGVVWGAWVNAALSMWISDLKEPGFTELRYRVDDVLFGDPPPGLRFSVDAPVGRDGEVSLDVADDACNGVYIAEQGRQVPLERTDRGRTAQGTITAQDTVIIASGDGWQLEVVAGEGRVGAVLRRGDRIEAGTPVPFNDQQVHVEAVVDPIVGELSVRFDGELSLFSFDVPAGPVRWSSAIEPDAPRDDSLCRLLQARR